MASDEETKTGALKAAMDTIERLEHELAVAESRAQQVALAAYSKGWDARDALEQILRRRRLPALKHKARVTLDQGSRA